VITFIFYVVVARVEWRNNKAYIIVQALTLQWTSKLFRNI
jgi:hypothetical protein